MSSNLNLAAAAAATSEFVNMDEIRGILALALVGAERNPLRRNLVLWGPGGYGKSEFVHDYIKAAVGTPPFVVSMHREYSAAEHFGGLSVPDLQGGTLRYNTEQSWMGATHSIWEEALDSPDSVLLSSKDTITRGVFTIGQPYQVKTKLIVINTNHDPARFKGDLSKAAFLERFPYVAKVDWSGISISDREVSYRTIIENTAAKSGNPFGKKSAQILASIAANEQWSPRRLIHVVQAAQDFCALTEKSTVKTVDNSHLLAVSEILGYETAEAIKRMEDEERRQKIESFRSSMNSVLRVVENRIRENFADATAAAKVFKEQRRILDGFVDQSINARREFGEEANDTIDGILEGVDEIRNEIQERWMDMM